MCRPMPSAPSTPESIASMAVGESLQLNTQSIPAVEVAQETKTEADQSKLLENEMKEQVQGDSEATRSERREVEQEEGALRSGQEDEEQDQHAEDKHEQRAENRHAQQAEDELEQHLEDVHGRHAEVKNKQRVEDEHEKQVEDEHEKQVEDEHEKQVEDEHEKQMEDEHEKQMEDEHEKQVDDEHEQRVEDGQGQQAEDELEQHLEDVQDQHAEVKHQQRVDDEHEQQVKLDSRSAEHKQAGFPEEHQEGSKPKIKYSKELGAEHGHGIFQSKQSEQEQKVEPEPQLKKHGREVTISCDGRRVYTYDLPPSMNIDILKNCSGKLVPWLNFCAHHQNYGFGIAVNTTNNNFRKDWYGTDAYMLEVIFYERMRTYTCRTSNPGEADLFFIPFFSGLEALPYLYTDGKRRLQQGRELVEWLEANATQTWRRHGGHDHFLIAGRTAWDFCRPLTAVTWWGTSLFSNPEMENTTAMLLERRSWRGDEMAVPYPVGFHPSTSASLQSWIKLVRSSTRKYLFSFSGALRPQLVFSIREILSQQCTQAGSACSRLDCGKIKCSHEPQPIYTSLLQAKFCLQPRGDTATRRSVIDSIVSGCIPVFFHKDTAFTQYRWHLPNDYDNFSVFIDEEDIKNGKADVKKILEGYSAKQVEQMRERLIGIIPNVLYRHPKSKDLSESMRDAFDLTIEGMAQKAIQFKSST
uniref:Exostosin GT47 domain-containing protein n=2 Tax=Physcomitrium patens TaxID=3218 RepID=A0A2K1JM47_PHYPA|nr:hypothetical protein PHYPA_017441 [Physcomitrium patens]